MQIVKAAVAVLISDKLGFQIRNAIGDKEGYFIMIEGFILEGHEYPKCVCIY